MKSEISGENTEAFGRNSQRAFGKTLLRLEENASAFEFKCTCVFGKCASGSFEGGWRVKTFEDFRFWNEINYG